MRLIHAEPESQTIVESTITAISTTINGKTIVTALFAMSAVCVDACLSSDVPIAQFIEVLQDMHDNYVRKSS